MDAGENTGLIWFVWVLSAVAIAGLIAAYLIIPG